MVLFGWKMVSLQGLVWINSYAWIWLFKARKNLSFCFDSQLCFELDHFATPEFYWASLIIPDFSADIMLTALILLTFVIVLVPMKKKKFWILWWHLVVLEDLLLGSVTCLFWMKLVICWGFCCFFGGGFVECCLRVFFSVNLFILLIFLLVFVLI